MTSWKPISSAPAQTEVLVCNAALLGWWAVAIYGYGDGWLLSGGPALSRVKLPHDPTHWQSLPSIQSLRSAEVGHA